MAQGTKEQILEAAERLFVERGIDAVSLRTITAEAGVNLAAVHYHFGSKEALVKAVFARRVEPINRRRLEMLDEAEARAGDGPLPVADVVRALIDPPLRASQQGESGPRLMHLCGRIYAEQSRVMSRIFDELFAETVKRFSGAFGRALPGLPEADLGWRIHFCVGAMAHVLMQSEKIRRYSFGACDPADVEGIIERLVSFLVAGLTAAVTEPRADGSVGALKDGAAPLESQRAPTEAKA